MTRTATTRPLATNPADAAPLATRILDTPIGPLLLVASDAGLRAVLWPGEDGSRVRIPLGGEPGAGGADAVDGAASGHLDRAAAQLAEYFAGTRRTFEVALDPVGTPFQLRAWQALRDIPYGRTSSYREQATALGDPRKARAVGGANRRNPISVIVPCHRVVGRSGALTGFAGGLDTKAWLLAHEQRVLAAD